MFAYAQKASYDSTKIDWKTVQNDSMGSLCQRCNDGDLAACNKYITLLKHFKDSTSFDEAQLLAFWEDKSIMLGSLINTEEHEGKNSPHYISKKERWDVMPKRYIDTGHIFHGPPIFLTKMSCYFHTNGDNKDKDTQLNAIVFQKDHVIAQLICCTTTEFPAKSYNGTFDMPIQYKTSKEDLMHDCTYQISIRAVGNDNWEFDAFLKATFSDGSTLSWTFLNWELNSKHSDMPLLNFGLK